MPATITPNKYAIEIRNKAFFLQRRLEAYASNIRWEWNRIGGCGRCTFAVEGDNTRIAVQADDDVRIYLPNEDGLTAALVYRGYVDSAAPSVSGGKESIQVECAGYFDWFKRIIVHD
ncbi:MAG: hypothetical protein HY587_03260, partial [Candidatus Omnitrophica bacterium]|nr:hypothetical protein [Candidatus Omnitrophota bacterium]